MELLQREAIYLWYYFDVQLRQILLYWVLGMALGSAISVFLKDRIHGTFRFLGQKKLGLLGVILSSILGIASPLCMYGTIPIAACSFFYDHRTGNKNHQSRGIEDSFRCQTVCSVSCICHVLFSCGRAACQLDDLIQAR